MKKQLLLGSALLLAISAFPQQRHRVNNSTFDITPAKKMALMNKVIEEKTPFNTPSSTSQQINPVHRTSANNWMPFTGSANPNGVVVSTQRPLQYNESLNTVSFIHRKSATYQANPTPPVNLATGVIVAMISSNGGSTWDSTCIWNHNVHTGRFPQGLVYNPAGNTSIGNAYVVGSGPALPFNPSTTGNWSGNFFASKKLNVFNNVAATTPSTSQQFIPNTNTSTTLTPSWGAVGKIDFARYEMTTVNGNIYLAGLLENDVNNASDQGLRGFEIVKGTYNASSGDFTWSKWDTLSINNPAAPHSFNVELDPDDNSAQIFGEPHMCWNEAGTVGYFWTVGIPAGHTVGANGGFQPLVWKYDATSTPTWIAVPFVDYALPEFTSLLNHIDGANETNNRYPNFSGKEEWDGIVDANNNLHIFSAIFGSNDTVQGHQGYDINGEKYNWNHEATGAKPYLYDFTYTSASGHPWKTLLIDSLDTEAPGTSTQNSPDGFQDNPWSVAENSKPAVSARLQMSRTTDGQYILYTWADSDHNLANGKYWNNIPSLKVRAYSLALDTLYEQRYTATAGSDIDQQAYFHYASPKCAKISTAGCTVNLMLPMTASTNSVSPGLPDGATHNSENSITHYYSSVPLKFYRTGCDVGIKENSLNSAQSSVIYPNPAKNNATLAIDLKDNSKVEITVLNIVGQQEKATSAAGQIGTNNVNVDLSGLSAGIYMVNVKIGNATSTKKLIVE